MKNKSLIALFIISVFFVQACKKDTNTSNQEGIVTVKLTNISKSDTSLFLDLKSVLIYSEHELENVIEKQWNEIATKDSIYNLNSLYENEGITIAEGNLRTGEVLQLALLIGGNNNIITIDDTFNLTIPDLYHDGIVVNINDSIVAGKNLEILLSFDSKASVKKDEHGLFSFEPVVSIIGNKDSNI